MKNIIIAVLALAAFTLGYCRGEETAGMAKAINGAETLAAKAIQDGNLPAAKGWSEVATQLRLGAYIAPFGELASQFSGQIKNLSSFVVASSEVSAAAPTTEWYRDPFGSATVAAVIGNDVAVFKAAVAKSAIWEALRSATQDEDGRLSQAKMDLDSASYKARESNTSDYKAAEVAMAAAKAAAKPVMEKIEADQKDLKDLRNPSPAQFAALRAWIDAGCPATSDQFVGRISTLPNSALKLPPLIALLRDSKVAVK